MSYYPCVCGAKSAAMREGLRDAYPDAPICPACQGPVDSNGKTLEPQPVIGASDN
jgi:hypothetical protein